MFAVRYVALVALVVWLGGTVVLGLLVAPATFNVLQANDPATGRMLAGVPVGDVMHRFHLMAFGCGAVIFISLFIIKFVGPPPRAFVLRAALVFVMLALEGYSGGVVARKITRMQSQVSGPIGQLANTDQQRLRFDRLHQTSTALMTANLALGLILLLWYARE